MTSQPQNATTRRQPQTAPFLANFSSLPSGRSLIVPKSRGARARSIARDVDAKSLVGVVLGFYVKATGEDGVQMRQKLAHMRPAALQQSRERWQKRAEEVQRFQGQKSGSVGTLQKTRRPGTENEGRLQDGVQVHGDEQSRSQPQGRREAAAEVDRRAATQS